MTDTEWRVARNCRDGRADQSARAGARCGCGPGRSQVNMRTRRRHPSPTATRAVAEPSLAIVPAKIGQRAAKWAMAKIADDRQAGLASNLGPQTLRSIRCGVCLQSHCSCCWLSYTQRRTPSTTRTHRPTTHRDTTRPPITGHRLHLLLRPLICIGAGHPTTVLHPPTVRRTAVPRISSSLATVSAVRTANQTRLALRNTHVVHSEVFCTAREARSRRNEQMEGVSE
jgi:hypothetical protein